VVAAFDFDGTLARGGSVWRFLEAVRGRRRVLAASAAVLPRLVLAAVLGGDYADRAKQALFVRVLGGLPATEVEQRAESFGPTHFRRQARTEVCDRLQWHRSLGHKVVIVSASPECYLKPVAAELGIDGVIGTRLAVSPDGLLTGVYDGDNCRGQQKLDRLRQWMETSVRGPQVESSILWAYGNSAGDRQLLAAADVGVDVGRLGRFGKLRSFPRLSDLDQRIS
jgi:phosphatidylglycerophosphatase C